MLNMMIYDAKSWLGILEYETLAALATASVKMLLLAVFIFASLKLFRVKNSQTQHLAWVIVLCGMLILPATSYLITPPVSLAILPESSKPAVFEQTVIPAYAVRDEPGDRVNDSPGSSEQLAAGTAENQYSPGATSSSPSPPPAPVNSESFSARPSLPGYSEILQTTLLTIYFSGLFIMLFRFARIFSKSKRLLASCKNINDERITELCAELIGNSPFRRRITVLSGAAITAPVTAGLFRPKILLPEDWAGWEDLKIKSVLAHELSHIRRNDYLFLLLATLNKCVNWFNPLSWLVARRLSDLAEAASDYSAICLVEDSNRYAVYLLELAAKTRANVKELELNGVSMIRKSQVAKRIDLILQTDRTQLNENKYLKTLINVFCFCLLFAVVIAGLELWSSKSGRVLAKTQISPEQPERPRIESIDANSPGAVLNPSSNQSPQTDFADKQEQNQLPAVASVENSQPIENSQPVEKPQPEQAPQANPLSDFPANENESTAAVKQTPPGTADTSKEIVTPPAGDAVQEKPKEQKIQPASAGNGDNNSIETLISSLNDSDPAVRRQAAAALKLKRDKQSVDSLIRLLNDNNANVRQQAAETLGAIGDQRAIKPLINTLKDGNSLVRQTSSRALGDIGGDTAVAPLQELSGDNNQFVRREAENSLKKLGKKRY